MAKAQDHAVAKTAEKWLDVSNYLHELEIPVSGSHGWRTYEGSDRMASTRKVVIPWEYLGRLVEVSPFLRGALATVLAGPS